MSGGLDRRHYVSMSSFCSPLIMYSCSVFFLDLLIIVNYAYLICFQSLKRHSPLLHFLPGFPRGKDKRGKYHDDDVFSVLQYLSYISIFYCAGAIW